MTRKEGKKGEEESHDDHRWNKRESENEIDKSRKQESFANTLHHPRPAGSIVSSHGYTGIKCVNGKVCKKKKKRKRKSEISRMVMIK